MNYYPYYTTPQIGANNNVNQPVNNTGIIWVSGEAGARAYLVAPNCTVQLWDSESPTIYLKSADASGMPSMKRLKYTVEEPENKPKTADVSTYATKTEIEELKARIEEISRQIKEAEHEPISVDATTNAVKK